jgi:hypothetical protein
VTSGHAKCSVRNRLAEQSVLCMMCLGEAEHALAWQDQADRAGLNCMKAERIYNLEDSLCAFSPSCSIYCYSVNTSWFLYLAYRTYGNQSRLKFLDLAFTSPILLKPTSLVQRLQLPLPNTPCRALALDTTRDRYVEPNHPDFLSKSLGVIFR